MVRKLFSENESGKTPIIFTLLRALAISVLFTLASFAIFSVIITYTSLSEASGDIVVTAVTLIAVMLSGFEAAKKSSSRGWLWGLIGGIAYITTVYITGLAINGNSGISTKVISFFLISGTIGALGGIIGINTATHTSK